MSLRGCAVIVVLAAAAVGAPALSPAASAATQRPASHAPSLTLSKSTALPGVKVTFHGQHFRAHEVVVLRWASKHGAKLTTVKASGHGAIAGKFAVPNPNGKGGLKTGVVAVGAKDHKTARAGFRQMCSDEWAAKGGGSWSAARDWSTHAVPGAADIACVTRYHRSVRVPRRRNVERQHSGRADCHRRR